MEHEQLIDRLMIEDEIQDALVSYRTDPTDAAKRRVFEALMAEVPGYKIVMAGDVPAEPASESEETFRCNDCGEDIPVSEMCGEWDDLCASCNSEREEQDDE